MAASSSCHVCGEPLPIELGHIHHIKPQSTGKLPDNSPINLAYLCPNCHVCLHKAAGLIMKNKAGAARDLAEQTFVNNKNALAAAKRLLELAVVVVKEIRMMEEGEKERPKTTQVVFTIPTSQYLKLKVIGAARNHGKPGVSPLLRQLVSDIVDAYFSDKDTTSGNRKQENLSDSLYFFSK